MGDWWQYLPLTPTFRNNGCRKQVGVVDKLVSNSSMLAPFKKTAFFLNGGVYSLDEGLLMGDPLRTPFVTNKKNILSAIAAMNNVVNCIRKMKSRFTEHANSIE
jgi:hypothetical protein